MGRGNETFGKKEVQAKNEKKRKEKEKKRQDRKQQSRDGNNLDDMIAYVDEYGKITSTPPDLTRKSVINAEDIELGATRNKEPDPAEVLHKGIVSFFNESKGYGFIRDSSTGQNIFVHANGLTETIKDNNKVLFEVTTGPKGLSAVNVRVVRG